jgi:hypothetical protein
LALSQGDISGVKENNALFTENVATRIVAYAESIGQEIYHARHRIALLPQNWTLEDTGQDQPKLTNFQGFFFEADSEAALQQKLTQYALGGTCLLQYARSKEELAYMWKAPYAMVCRVLPENMSYAGPLPTPNLKETLSLATMPLFYALWLGEVHPTIPLSQAETHAFETLRDTQNHYQDTLIKHPAYSQATWHAMEEALFDPHVFFSAASSPASWLHGPYSQAQQATCDALCQKAPCYTLATRPHPIGLLSKTQEKAFGLAPDTLCLML